SARCDCIDMRYVSSISGSLRIKCTAESPQERRYTRRPPAANRRKAFDCLRFFKTLNALVENAIIAMLPPTWSGQAATKRKQISGGDDQRGRTRVAGAAGAPATGTPRSRCGYRSLGNLARFRSDPGPKAQKAQADPARQNPPDRGSAHPRYHRVAGYRQVTRPRKLRPVVPAFHPCVRTWPDRRLASYRPR